MTSGERGNDTPETTRAVAGGSDRLLRSQSKTQSAANIGVGNIGGAVTGPSGGVGGVAPPHIASTRTGANQQNWY